MEFKRLVEIVDHEPVFETGLLLAGKVDPDQVRQQLTRWTKAGRIYRLRRGLYSLAPPYQKVRPHSFVIANRMVPGSVVSLQSALAYYGLIPESVPTTMSVTSDRPRRWDTPMGSFAFRHVRTESISGYHLLDLGRDEKAEVALPEKALLDLVYLTPGGDAEEYLRSLRLQNLELLDAEVLLLQAQIFGKPKVSRAADRIISLAEEERVEFRTG
jgi:predicted transcriptional regulator of viral defense system